MLLLLSYFRCTFFILLFQETTKLYMKLISNVIRVSGSFLIQKHKEFHREGVWLFLGVRNGVPFGPRSFLFVTGIHIKSITGIVVIVVSVLTLLSV